MYYIPENVLRDLHDLSQNRMLDSHQIKFNLVENYVPSVSLKEMEFYSNYISWTELFPLSWISKNPKLIVFRDSTFNKVSV